MEAEYPVGYAEYPPAAYIVTTSPVYYEGRATYWYGGRWYYRDGGRWSYYHRAPPMLRERHVQGVPVRRNYERARPAARPAGRPAVRAGGHHR